MLLQAALLTHCPKSMERLANDLLGPKVLSYREAVRRSRGLLGMPYEEKVKELQPLGLLGKPPPDEVDSLFVAFTIIKYLNSVREVEGRMKMVIMVEEGEGPSALVIDSLRIIYLGNMASLKATDVALHESLHNEGGRHGWRENATTVSYCFHDGSVEEVYRKLKIGREYPTRAYLVVLAPFVKRLYPYAKPSSITEVAKALGYSPDNHYPNQLLAFTYYTFSYPLEEGTAEVVARAILEGITLKGAWCCYKEVLEIVKESLMEAGSAYEALQLTWEKAKELAEKKGIAYDAPKP